MAFSISASFRRSKKARDPFGGDDDEDFYDDEPEERNIGRIIAFGLSGTMGLLLVGFIAVVVITADESAGPASSSIPMEISQIVSEDGEVLQNLTTTTDSRAVSAAPPRFTTLPKAEQFASAPDAAARVAIIVEGLGLNRTATEAAIETLPSNVTLAFSPYARNLQDWLQKAIEAGHEVLVEVPMESNRYPADDQGPLGLLMSLDQIENVDRLSAILEKADGTVGILDVSGSRFRESEENINIVMNNLDARGLFYVQGRPGLRLGNNKVPSATAGIVLDERAFRASIDARLDYVERLAKYQGSSVAVASAKPVTFERIALWLDEIGRRGVAIAPVSQVLIQ